MPKVLCIIGLVAAGLLAVVFLLDLILLFAGMPALAPFRGLSPVLDGAFLVAALGLGWLSYSTFREQV